MIYRSLLGLCLLMSLFSCSTESDNFSNELTVQSLETRENCCAGMTYDLVPAPSKDGDCCAFYLYITNLSGCEGYGVYNRANDLKEILAPDGTEFFRVESCKGQSRKQRTILVRKGRDICLEIVLPPCGEIGIIT